MSTTCGLIDHFFGEFFGAFVRGFDGSGDTGADVCLIQDMHPINGCTGRRSATVLQFRGMFAGLEECEGRALSRFGGELDSSRAVETHFEGAVSQGVDVVVDERQSLTAQSTGRVHLVLRDVLQLRDRRQDVSDDWTALLAVGLHIDGTQPYAVSAGSVEAYPMHFEDILLRVFGIQKTGFDLIQRHATHQRQHIQRVLHVWDVVSGEGVGSGTASLVALFDDRAVEAEEDHIESRISRIYRNFFS
jgi:hypothetical protein